VDFAPLKPCAKSNDLHSVALVSDLRQVALKAADRLPGFSVVLPQALSLCAREDVISISELAAAIEHDVVIAGSMLSLANSALYSRGQPIVTLRQAIVRVGIRKTRNVLLGLSVMRSVGKISIPPGWSTEQFNAHSVATAILSDLIVQNTLSNNSEWAFVTGLLYDIGLLLIGAGLPEHFGAITAHSGSDVEIVENERELLGFTHFELGADLLARWNYPPVVHQAVRICPQIPVPCAHPLSLAAVVSAGSQLADAHHVAILSSYVAGDDSGADLMQTLSIADSAKFFSSFENEYQSFREYTTVR